MTNHTDQSLKKKVLDILDKYHQAEHSADAGIAISLYPYADQILDIITQATAEAYRQGQVFELNKIKTDARKDGTWTEDTAGGIEMEVDERLAELQGNQGVTPPHLQNLGNIQADKEPSND